MRQSAEIHAVRVADYLDRDEAILAHATGRILHLGLGVSVLDVPAERRPDLIRQCLHGKLSARFDEVTGVEIDEESVRAFQQVLGNAILGNVEQLDRLSFDRPFDTVVAADIIEHLSNPGLMLESLRSHCHTDTRLIITTPHAFGLPNTVRFLMGRFREAPDHVLAFNLSGLRNLLRRHGYVVKYVATCHQPTISGTRFVLARTVLRRFPRLGGTIFMVVSPR